MTISRISVAAMAIGVAILTSCTDGDPGAASGSAVSTTTTTAAAAPLSRYEGYESTEHADPARWVCRPDVADDICDGDLDVTVVAANGTLTVEPFRADPDAPIDCFYLYPTVSQDPTSVSDWDASDDEEGWATLNQVARLGSECRVFAPIYRQVTTTSLRGQPTPGGEADPFADVLDAFRTYMAHDNHGRGFVLVSHSQGTLWALRLLADEIEPHPEVRDLLVGAYLAGGRVGVPPGELVGGDLQVIPMCSADGQTGCVTAWSSYAAGGGPEARSEAGSGVGGLVGACVNPAAPGSGSAELDPHFTTALGTAIGPGADGEGGGSWLDGDAVEITTPFVRVPGLATAECSDPSGDAHLAVTITADPTDPRADTLPAFDARGSDLHLLDVDLVMGNVVDQVARQAETFLATR